MPAEKNGKFHLAGSGFRGWEHGGVWQGGALLSMTNVNHILKSNSDKLCILFRCQTSTQTETQTPNILKGFLFHSTHPMNGDPYFHCRNEFKRQISCTQRGLTSQDPPGKDTPMQYVFRVQIFSFQYNTRLWLLYSSSVIYFAQLSTSENY